MDITERAQREINMIEGAVSGAQGHRNTYRVCRILTKNYGLDVETAWPILLSYNDRCDPPWSEKELRRKLESAALKPATHGEDKTKGQKQEPDPSTLPPLERFTKAKPKYKVPARPTHFTTAAPKADMKLINQLAAQGKPVLTPHFLANISTKDPLLVSPNDYLSALFDADRGEKTIIFSNRATQGQCLWPDEADKIPTSSPEGIIFLGQPVDGFFRLNSENKKTRRSGECILSWKHALLESDDIEDKALWLQALITLPIPIISITFSGKRSLHVLLKIPAKTHKEWLNYINAIKAPLALIGADVQALTNHLVMPRLPGAYRTIEGQNKCQQLLYFNPNPLSRPLMYSTPLHDVATYWSNQANDIAQNPEDWPQDAIIQTKKACAAYNLKTSLIQLLNL